MHAACTIGQAGLNQWATLQQLHYRQLINLQGSCWQLSQISSLFVILKTTTFKILARIFHIFWDCQSVSSFNFESTFEKMQKMLSIRFFYIGFFWNPVFDDRKCHYSGLYSGLTFLMLYLTNIAEAKRGVRQLQLGHF